MSYEFFLALRYLRSRRKKHLARVTALAAVTGLACGVAALTLALSLANGFRDEIRDKILRGTAHITLAQRDGAPLTDWRAIATRLSKIDGVSSVSATTYDGALLASAETTRYAVLRGVDMESPRAIEELRRITVEGDIAPLLRSDNSPSQQQAFDTTSHTFSNQTSRDPISETEENLPPVIIGSELAAHANMRIGDIGTIISANATLASPDQAPRSHRVRIAAIFRSGLYEYDATWAYVTLATAAHLSGTPLSASAINIETIEPDEVGKVAARVRDSLGDRFIVIDWREANRPLFAALTLERRVVLTVIALIVLVAALNITTSLALLVIERRAEIAILGALGSHPMSIMLIFLLEGAIIGAVGACAGVALGVAAVLVGNYFKLISLPADVYSITSVPLHVSVGDVALAALAAFVLSVLATIYPARAASRMRPAEILRYE